MKHNYELAVSIKGNIVRLELILRGEYDAIVTYDDIIERLQSGDGFSLTFNAPKQNGITEIVSK